MATPQKPAAASKEAVYVPALLSWEDRSDPKRLRAWSSDGVFIVDAALENGKLHGPLRWLQNGMDDASILQREALGLPEAQDPLYELEAEYEHGELRRAVFYSHVEERELGVATTWKSGKLEGPATWFVHRTGSDFSVPFLKHGAVAVTSKTFKIPKPWPDRIEAIFAKGKLASSECFDKNGERVGKPVAKVADWGASTASVDGYVESKLAADLDTFFASKPKVKAKAARPSKEWLGKVAPAHRKAATAFAKIVESGKFPFLGTAFDVNGFGFDTGNLEGDAKDPRYVGLSSDGSGNPHLLDLETGKVMGREHEGDFFDPKRTFDSIDAYAFALVRVEAALAKQIPTADLKKTFERLGIKAGVHELKLASSNG